MSWMSTPTHQGCMSDSPSHTRQVFPSAAAAPQSCAGYPLLIYETIRTQLLFPLFYSTDRNEATEMATDSLGTKLISAGGTLLGAAIVLQAVNLAVRAVYNLLGHPLSSLPGRKTWASSRLPFVRGLANGRLVQEIEDMHRQFGPIVRVAPDGVSFAHPDAWNDILLGRPGQRGFQKDPTWWTPMPGQAPGVITAIDDGLHAVLRRQISPGFTSRALREQEAVVQQYVDLLINRWRGIVEANHGEGEIDVLRWFNYLTFDIFGDLAFAESFDCLRRSEYHQWIAVIFDNLKYTGLAIAVRFQPVVAAILEFISPGVVKLLPAWFLRAQRGHTKLITDKVQRRLAYKGDKLDFMSGFQTALETESEGKEKSVITIDHVNATFSQLAIAASETTAMALSATLNILIHHTDKLEMVTKEVRDRFQSYDEITVSTVRDLAYVNAVLTETMRLCPPVPFMPARRIPDGGATVCGKWLPGGTQVSVTFTSMHREPSSWQAPNSFCPERWLPEAMNNPESPFFNDKRHAFQPFSIGPHSCLGQNLAWVEMRLALAKLLWTFDVSAPADPEKRVVWESLRTFLLIEKRPIRVVVKPRAEVAVK
ncbi:hypothetical protein QBC47DRAFT_391732 [Echria macrotheca]|uniref:Cytochrome P450 n=1 Tax=Echria macrotheca TaxID=438768 RepID=A0AAJ0B6N7_9PEZI|nr:hypothetical protein QBC47DRAFT_391732 [Echria macrotheca]